METLTNVKGIIFDYGGTIDTRGDHWSWIIYKAYQSVGLEISLDAFRSIYVEGERALAREHIVQAGDNFHQVMLLKAQAELDALKQMGVTAGIEADTARRIADYCYDYARGCVDAVRPTLELLSKNYPMVLVSNFYGNIDAVLRDFDLRQYFNGIIESAVVGVRKPDSRIFAMGVTALDLPADQVLVVGDSLRKDILPARSLGCMTAWIKGRGWTDDEDSATDPAQIPNLQALPQLLGLNEE